MGQCDEALEANHATNDDEQTARNQANSFAQLRRLSHHRYQLWKRQRRVQRPESIAKVAVHESAEELPATPGPEDIGSENVTQERLDVVIPEASHDGEAQELSPAPEGELRSLQDTEEHQYEPPQDHDLAPEQVELQMLGNLQSCSQVQSQVDESQTTKESPSVVSTCKTCEEEIKPQVKSILSSVTFINSPSFSAWTPCETADEHRMSLSNVEFRACEQTGLQLKSSCDFTNVKFIGCKFNRTTFLDVKLSGVTFNQVNFTDSAFCCLVLCNVTLTKTRFKNDIWRATHLGNALVDRRSFKLRRGTTRDYLLRLPLASSRTRQSVINNSRPLNNLNQILGHDGFWDRDIYRCFTSSGSGILTRLALHKDIMDRILQYCFPGSSVHIYEYPQGFKIPEETRALNMVYTTRSDVQTSYFGSQQLGLAVVPVTARPSKNIPQRGIGNCAGLFLVNKKISDLASNHLYSRTYHLQCSAEGAREFLLEHPQKIKFAKQLVLYYHWSDDQLGLATDIHAWRRLLGTIRHQFSFIKHIRVHVGQSFWKRNNLAMGAGRMLESCSDTDRPFVDVDKFAAPAHRWTYDGDMPAPWTGTNLQIHIEGASTQRQINFVKEILAEIEKQRVGRPLFILSPKGTEITYNRYSPSWDDW